MENIQGISLTGAIKKAQDRKDKRDEKEKNNMVPPEAADNYRYIKNIPTGGILKGFINDFKNYYHDKFKMVEADKCATDIRIMHTQRHDLWVDFLQRNNKKKMDFNDIDFNKFCVNVLKIPEIAKNMTPDVLHLDVETNCIYIGDIGVSKRADNYLDVKMNKYKPLREHLKKHTRCNIIPLNFVITSDLSNVNDVINFWNNTAILEEYDCSDALIEVKGQHNYYNSIMQSIEFACVDVDAMYDIMKLTEKVINDDVIDYGTELNEAAEKYVPKFTEDELGEMIKKQVELMKADYFDKTFEETDRKFEELYNNYTTDTNNPKGTLKIVQNSHYVEELTSHSLIKDYIKDLSTCEDSDDLQFLKNALPSLEQIKIMKKFKELTEDVLPKHQPSFINDIYPDCKVYGSWQYKMYSKGASGKYNKFKENCLKNKTTNRNECKKPKRIHRDNFEECHEFISRQIDYLGSKSNKKTFIPINDWAVYNQIEEDATVEHKELYQEIMGTNGVQVAHSLSMFHERLIHLSTSKSMRDNIFIPPNGSFICIVPSGHAPINNNNSNLPLLFITRKLITDEIDPVNEYDFSIQSNKYEYFVSKLCRLSMDKISNWDQAGYKVLQNAHYLLSNNSHYSDSKKEIIGLVTMLTLDVHQKTSELLELLKYVSFMPFAEVNRLSSLVMDKFNIMLKTRLDVYVLLQIRNFMSRLKTQTKAYKKQLSKYQGVIQTSTLGIVVNMPSFIETAKHVNINTYIEEIAMLFMLRGKKLYGDQFMIKSLKSTAKWNEEYLEEMKTYGNWCTDGKGNGDFPFDAKFCFSADAIHYATLQSEKNLMKVKGAIEKKLTKLDYNQYPVHNCTLRGSTKERKYRTNATDLHTTSLEACLKEFKDLNYEDEKCTNISLANNVFLKPGYIAQYSMSPKEQRGSGRPIATPTFHTKIANNLIEKPEQAIGTYCDNNILVSGKNKSKAQSDAYISALNMAAQAKNKKIYQCAEDQSKWSENDNTRKYLSYFQSSQIFPPELRSLQHACLKKMINREHLCKTVQKSVGDDPMVQKYLNNDHNGIKAIIGWPQGMLNNLSTTIHSYACNWITKMFNKVYNKKVVVTDLVHSDDSWYVISCDSVEDFELYAMFRICAKKLFCLKTNEKKFWGSSILGELVSNFNSNGEVIVPICKTICNSMQNMYYQNWVMDVHNLISSLQQAYKSGATIPDLIALFTTLRSQLFSAYNVRRKDIKLMLMQLLPVELGGFPSMSVFELATTGLNAHYKYISDKISSIKEDDLNNELVQMAKTIILKTIFITKKHCIESDKVEIEGGEPVINVDGDLVKDEDYTSVVIPNKGEIFACIRHIMPKSRKVKITLKAIMDLPYESDGLELLIPRPESLKVALGHLKASCSSMLFALATEGYTQNKRRLAMNQVLQSTGKTVKVLNSAPMTMSELHKYILNYNCGLAPTDDMNASFNDDTEITEICSSIVNFSTTGKMSINKIKVLNKVPHFDSKFQTTCNIQHVLLGIIDKDKKTQHLVNNVKNTDKIMNLQYDMKNFRRRFDIYFKFYTVEYACKLIMQQYINRIKQRLYIQPLLNNHNLSTFYTSLYGNTISKVFNYDLNMHFRSNISSQDDMIIRTIFTTFVLDRLYPGKFTLTSVKKTDRHDANIKTNVPIVKYIKDFDFVRLNHDSMIRLAMLKKVLLNDSSLLEKLDSKNLYVQEWRLKQEWNKTTRSYTGDFIVEVGYKTVKLVISYREKAGIRIVYNHLNISDMLEAMQIFVRKCFPYDRYPLPNMWGHCRIWESSISTYNADYLTFYNTNSTRITCWSNMVQQVLIVKNEKIKVKLRSTKGSTYMVDKLLRTVDRKDSEGTIDKVVLKASMNLGIIDRDNYSFETAYVCGIANEYLLGDNIMPNLTLGKMEVNNVTNYGKLIKVCTLFGFYNGVSLLIRLLSIRNKRYRQAEVANPVLVYESDYVKRHNYELCDQSIFIRERMENLVVKTDEVSMEVLDIDLDGDRLKGNLTVYKDIIEPICKTIFRPITDLQLRAFIQRVLSSNVFHWILSTGMKVKSDDFPSGFVPLDSLADFWNICAKQIEVSPDLFAFLYTYTTKLTNYQLLETALNRDIVLLPRVYKVTMEFITVIADITGYIEPVYKAIPITEKSTLTREEILEKLESGEYDNDEDDDADVVIESIEENF